MTDDKNQTVNLSCGLIHVFGILCRRIQARGKRLKDKYRETKLDLLNANWIFSTIAEMHSSLASRYCSANSSAGVYQSTRCEWQCAGICHVLRDRCLWECHSRSGMLLFHVYSLFYANIWLNASVLFCSSAVLLSFSASFITRKLCYSTQYIQK